MVFPVVNEDDKEAKKRAFMDLVRCSADATAATDADLETILAMVGDGGLLLRRGRGIREYSFPCVA